MFLIFMKISCKVKNCVSSENDSTAIENWLAISFKVEYPYMMIEILLLDKYTIKNCTHEQEIYIYKMFLTLATIFKVKIYIFCLLKINCRFMHHYD